MKRIINRRTGRPIEDPYEAKVLIRDVKKVYPFVQSDEHLAPHGRTSAFIAEKDLPAIREAHDGYICGVYRIICVKFKNTPSYDKI